MSCKNTFSKFIKNTQKRYTITSDGIVYSNYRYNKNGEKIFIKKELSRKLLSKEGKSLVVSLLFGKYSKNNKPKHIYINTLMEKCFSLTPPDKYHFYDLTYKDGNFLNSSLSNLVYKIRVLNSSKYIYYPQPFYNSNGKITHKICGICGKKKEIINFNLQKSKGYNKTYRNMCESCRAIKQWNYIKSDIDRFNKYKKKTKDWSETEIGKKYYKEYRKKMAKYEYDNITPHFIASSLKMQQKDLTPDIINISKKKILLLRQIKQKQNEQKN
jgi:hypothetical protein